jgi:hypothetical protein
MVNACQRRFVHDAAMSRSSWITGLLFFVAAVLAVGWWTPWLNPYVPGLDAWRQQARKTTPGQYLSATPEPRWVTVPGRDKAACLKQAGGELNEQFVLCRSGRRELVRENLDGTRSVLEMQALQEAQGLTPSGTR